VRSGIDAGSVSESFKTIFQYGTAKRDLAVKLNTNTVSVMTGSFGSTYAQIGADLGSVLDNGESLRVLPVLGRGSAQAVADVLLLRGVDAGIVRKDTLAYLSARTSPAASASSSSTSPSCSTRRCTSSHRGRFTV
jgi:TRAP-type uncharacterized transport system substrate-binding protein